MTSNELKIDGTWMIKYAFSWVSWNHTYGLMRKPSMYHLFPRILRSVKRQALIEAQVSTGKMELEPKSILQLGLSPKANPN